MQNLEDTKEDSEIAHKESVWTMELIYAYIDGFRQFKKCNLNFTAGSRWELRSEGRVRKLVKVADCGAVPYEGFFSTEARHFGRKKKAGTPVSSVSAIVGDNGAGKTSFAAFLQQVRLQHVSTFAFVEYVLLFKTSESSGIKCLTNIQSVREQVADWDQSDILISTMGEHALKNAFELVYLSPHYTIGSPFAPVGNDDEFAVRDLSTTHLMKCRARKFYGVGELNVRRLLSGYEYRELRLMLDVITALAPERHKTYPLRNMPLPMPRGVIIEWGREQFVLVVDYFRSRMERGQHGLKERKSKEIRAYKHRAGKILKLLEGKKGYTTDVVYNTFLTFAAICLFDAESAVRLKGEIPKKWDWFSEFLIAFLGGAVRVEGVPGCGKSIADILKSETDRHIQDEGAVLSNEEIVAFANLLELLETHRIVLKPQYDKTPYEIITPYRFYLDLEARGAKDLLDEMMDLAGNVQLTMDYLTWSFYPVLSSGEISLLSMYGRLYECYQQASDLGRDVILFIDEAETTLHPGWQRKLVWSIIRFMELFARKHSTHVVFATHSPTLLSDIPLGNICFLGADVKALERICRSNTFGANVFDLYYQHFSVREGPVGAFAQAMIQAVLEKKEDKVAMECSLAVQLTPEQRRLVVDMVGDPFVRDYLRRQIL